MAQILFLKRPPALILEPANAYDQEKIGDLRVGDYYKAVVTAAKERSKRQNDFYWTLLGKVANNNEREGCDTPANLHRWLKEKLGYYKKITFWDSTTIHIYDSTSFAAMDTVDFKTYFEAALILIVHEVIPGMPQRDLVNDVEAMLDYPLDSLWELAA